MALSDIYMEQDDDDDVKGEYVRIVSVYMDTHTGAWVIGYLHDDDDDVDEGNFYGRKHYNMWRVRRVE